MFAVLRFIGVVNAAIWLGAVVFGSFGVLPVFFTPEVSPGLIPKYHAGRIAELVLHRYFILQLICCGVAALHLLAERLYAGRAQGRGSAALLACLAALSLVGGTWIGPKLERLHLVKYATNTTAAQKAAATREFRGWHGVSQGMNLLLMLGVFGHFWRTAGSTGGVRATGPVKRGV